MKIRRTYLAACFALLFSSASFADETCSITPEVTLNQNQLPSEGGYISTQLSIANENCGSVKFKYWLSVAGPDGLYFPAKAVVGADTSPIESEKGLREGSNLNITRGIWVPEYMKDGKYTVSLQVVTQDGQIFNSDEDFAKGVDFNSLPAIDGVTLEVTNQLDIKNVASTGGYVPFSINVENGRDTQAKVEFWMSAIGPHGLVIPVHAREKWTIASGADYSKVRGFWFEEGYPAGYYVIKTEMVDLESGAKTESLLLVIKD